MVAPALMSALIVGALLPRAAQCLYTYDESINVSGNAIYDVHANKTHTPVISLTMVSVRVHLFRLRKLQP